MHTTETEKHIVSIFQAWSRTFAFKVPYILKTNQGECYRSHNLGLIQQPLSPPHPNDHLCQYSCNVAKQPYDTGKFPLLFYTVLQRQKRQSIQEESRKLFRTYIHRMIRDSDRRKSGEKKKKEVTPRLKVFWDQIQMVACIGLYFRNGEIWWYKVERKLLGVWDVKETRKVLSGVGKNEV